jgi:hypothetical protein
MKAKNPKNNAVLGNESNLLYALGILFIKCLRMTGNLFYARTVLSVLRAMDNCGTYPGWVNYSFH